MALWYLFNLFIKKIVNIHIIIGSLLLEITNIRLKKKKLYLIFLRNLESETLII